MNKTTTEMVDILQKFREDYVNHKNMTIEVGILLSDLVQEFIILKSIEDMDSSDDYTKDQVDFILRHRKLFEEKLFTPTYPNGEINHNYMKGFRLKNSNAKKEEYRKDYMSHVGLYQDTKKGSDNFGKLCFAIKDDKEETVTNEDISATIIKKGEHTSSWWLKYNKNTGISTISKTLEFEYPEITEIYKNTDFSALALK